MARAKKTAKKELRTKIAEQLTITFEGLKERISAKKFERRIEKATRILSRGLKTPKAEKDQQKKVAKKKSKQKEQIKLAATS